MAKSNPKEDADPAPFFSAVLTPHRSLSPGGFVVLMLVICAASFVAGTAFVMIGAWPVLGFFGLDVVLVFLAFRLNYRAARAFEEVQVSTHAVVVRRASASGKVREFSFNPYWARLIVERIKGEGVKRIALRSHGVSLAIGEFLNPADRTSFAEAFAAALRTARAGASA